MRSQISTEQLVTSPLGFGITTASPAQRAACRIIDGRPLRELAEHPDVVRLVGGADALAALPSESGHAPQEVVYLASIRSLKTITSCAAAVRMTQTVDVEGLGHGEVARVSIFSLTLDTASAAKSILSGTFRASPMLSPLVIEETADTILVRHPSGLPIEVKYVTLSRAGGSLVARWSAGIIADEAPRMSGAADSVMNLDDMRAAGLGRLLPGAQFISIGSPHAPFGPIYDLTQEYWGKPQRDLVVLRGTGPMLNPTWWTPERCAKLERQDRPAYTTDVLGEFADPESGLVNPIALHSAKRESPLELEPAQWAHYAAAVDLSGGGAGANASTLVIVERIETRPGDDQTKSTRFRVALAREWRGMRPEQYLEEMAAVCRRYKLSHATTDQFAASANADLARRYGLYLDVVPTTASSKVEDFTNLGTLIHAGAIELSPEPTLLRDLLSVKRRLTQQGVTIVLPRTSDGRHADYAPALASAIRAATTTFGAGVLRGQVGSGPVTRLLDTSSGADAARLRARTRDAAEFGLRMKRRVRGPYG